MTRRKRPPRHLKPTLQDTPVDAGERAPHDAAMAEVLRRQIEAPYCANPLRVTRWVARRRHGRVSGLKAK